MNLRQIMLDVDKAMERPTLIEIAQAIDAVSGVEGLSIVVNSIDMETVGLVITIEGENLNYEAIVLAIEKTGAAVHSLDQLLAGKREIKPVKRVR